VPQEKVADYLRKDDFGKVPAYLDEVKAEIKQENDLIDNFVAMQVRPPPRRAKRAQQRASSRGAPTTDANSRESGAGGREELASVPTTSFS
jgi:hypothetical protein